MIYRARLKGRIRPRNETPSAGVPRHAGLEAEGESTAGDAAEARATGEEPAGEERARSARDLEATVAHREGASRRQDGGSEDRPSRQVLRVRSGKGGSRRCSGSRGWRMLGPAPSPSALMSRQEARFPSDSRMQQVLSLREIQHETGMK